MDKKTRLIIETVKRYPVLYDTFHLDHKNNKLKNKIWDNIAEMIEASNGAAVKSRWKNLKDAFNKCIRANMPGSSLTYIQRYKTWPWKEHMSFLQPYLVSRSDLTVESDTEIDTKNTEPLIEALQYPQSPVPVTSVKFEARTSPYAQHELSRKRAFQNIQDDQSECEYQDDGGNSFIDNKNYEHDATDLIFLGYARTIKHLSNRRQAIIKFKIAKLIMEAELDQVDEQEISI